MSTKPRHKNSNKNLLLAALIAVVVVVFPVRMAWDKKSADEAQVTSDKAMTAQALAKIRDAQALELNPARTNATLKSVATAFPALPDLHSELKILRVAAAASGVQLVSAMQTAPVIGLGSLNGSDIAANTFGETLGSARSIPIDIKIEGLPPTIQAFMSYLRTSPRFFGIYEQSWSWNQYKRVDAEIQGQIGYLPGQPNPIRGR